MNHTSTPTFLVSDQNFEYIPATVEPFQFVFLQALDRVRARVVIDDTLWMENIQELQVQLVLEAYSQVELYISFTNNRVGMFHLECILQGQYAKVEVKGRYILTGSHCFTMTSVQKHQAIGTSSSLITKGLLYDTARGLYEGMIVIEPGAYKTYGLVQNKNILLSGDAVMKSKPNIEVKCADVQCFHGSAVAPLDKQLLWYAHSKGLDVSQATTMLLRAFMADVFCPQSISC